MGGHHARHHRGVSAARLGSNSDKIILTRLSSTAGQLDTEPFSTNSREVGKSFP
jgi:hypothetical protein